MKHLFTKKIRGIILLFLVLLFAAGVFFAFNPFSEYASAGTGDNVSGYAWSETIGWVSFNCTDTGTCPSIDYGVQVSPVTGAFSGYAWSETIGWIKFDPVGPYPGSPNNSGQLNLETGVASGWIRACAGAANPDCSGGTNPSSGGWDGWIKLDGVTYNGATEEFHGFAWGSDVVGWLSFNCMEGGANGENICGQSNYKVKAVGSPDSLLRVPPVAAISCTPSNCIQYSGDILTLNNDSTDENGQEDIVSSEWDIVDWGSVPDVVCASSPILCNYTVQTQVGTFQATLKVQDSAGASNTSSPISFTMKQDVIADFTCSLDQISWKDCVQVKPTKDEVVYFQDQSSPSEGAASIITRLWTFTGGTPASSTQTNPNATFSGAGAKQVMLTVTDSGGREKTKNISLKVGLPFPDYQEISPF